MQRLKAMPGVEQKIPKFALDMKQWNIITFQQMVSLSSLQKNQIRSELNNIVI